MSKASKLAIIPARAGSTRLKNKNIKPLNGKPLIEHTIDAVVESNAFDKIIVSSDSAEIKEIAQKKGLEFIQRPESFSTSKATVVSAIINLMENLNEKYDWVGYFLPTCPLRNAEDINQGLKLLADADSVISVRNFEAPIQLAMISGENDRLYPVFDNLKGGLTNSLFIQKHVRPSGGFYISKWDEVLNSGHFFNGVIRGSLLPDERCVDVDTEFDFQLAEARMR